MGQVTLLLVLLVSDWSDILEIPKEGEMMKVNVIGKTLYGYGVSVWFVSRKPRLVEIEPLRNVPFEGHEGEYENEVWQRKLAEGLDKSPEEAEAFWEDYREAVLGVAAKHGVELEDFNYEVYEEDFELGLAEDSSEPLK